ncbi:dihydroxy-acid dehydratase [Apiospora hydei]|uniref:Dihydroxy-acid dehydratase n=1 Tax=Apiospora hydei TaxID=1337664 RepID=A0ABR1V693_9PEZI
MDSHSKPSSSAADPKADPQYIQFDCLPPGGPLNRWSHSITREHDFPGAQAMLYGAGVTNEEMMKNAPHVGVATIWWEGNPCNTHLLEFGKIVKKSLENRNMLAWQYNAVGVSDAITMGGEVSPETYFYPAFATNTETTYRKVAAARHNRPFIMIYGGTIRKGHSSLLEKEINVSTCYEATGAYADVMTDIERHACPGAGACGGMYTANTMATAIEAMGMTLPGSSSYPALSPEKARECERAAEVIKTTMAKDIRPRDLITRESFENALVVTMILGGSTNGVLHFLAIANTAEVPLTLDDIQRVSDKTPFLADLAPSGKYYMEDLYKIGGTPSVLKMLIAAGLVNGNIPTVTGRTLGENVADWPSLAPDQKIIRPLNDPIKESGHIRILRGNMAPDGAVAKITGKEGLTFTGKARVFNKEHELNEALSHGQISRDESLVLIVRYEGPRGGPGMPEQLTASAAIMGAGLKNLALVTDGRYSGASHGFIVGHVTPEAARGGPIALVQDGDTITIDAIKNRIDIVNVSDEQLAERRRAWKPPVPHVRRGALAKYARLVGDASHGAVTDQWEDDVAVPK